MLQTAILFRSVWLTFVVVSLQIDTFGIICNKTWYGETLEQLEQIRQNIRSDLIQRSSYQLSERSCAEAFDKNMFLDFTDGLTVMVSNTRMTYETWGNVVGWILHNIACASIKCAHYIDLKLYEPRNPNRNGEFDPFVMNLPTVIVHQSMSKNDVCLHSKTANSCHMTYPWEGNNGPLRNHQAAQTVRRILNDAFDAAIYNESWSLYLSKGMKYNSTYITSNMTFNHSDIPDVTIHYRCSDNLSGKHMGLLSFSKIIRNIPKTARSIYIHTEGRQHEHISTRPHGMNQSSFKEYILENYDRCQHIIQALYDDLISQFKSSVVVVKIGSNLRESFRDILYSKLATICSASTFCLHTVLAKSTGLVYYPNTHYGSDTTFGFSNWNIMINSTFVWKYLDISTDKIIEILRNESLLDEVWYVGRGVLDKLSLEKLADLIY